MTQASSFRSDTRAALLATFFMLCAVPARAQQPAPGVPARYLDSARAAVAAEITPRTDLPAPAEPSTQWLAFIGEYGTTRDPLIVLEHNGLLHALFNGVSLQPLRALKADTFQFAADSQSLVFQRDRSGHVNGVRIPNALLLRRAVGTEDGATFRIVPLRDVAVLRREALAASPPVEKGDFLRSDLVDLQSLDSTIHYDIRYATTNNFMGEIFYSSARALMQRAAAEALVRASARLRSAGYGIVIHDAYRPWYVTKMFWDATPDSLKDFVADPAAGSRHNRGAAVDLSLYDLQTGRTVITVSGYDEFSPRAFPDYPGGTSRRRWYRALLRRAMEAEGFTVYRAEWWHFDYRDWRKYPIGNQRFEDVH
jgi:serine beta-lactamase-like protein LACTB